jgi:hypothetical protein
MRRPHGIVVSLTLIALASRLSAQSDSAAAQRPAVPAAPRAVADSAAVQQPVVLAAASTLADSTAGHQPAAAAATPPPRRLNTSGLTRFELQRLLNDLDERRRRLRSSIEPADSALRLFAADTERIGATARPAAVQRDSAIVHQLYNQYRQDPTNHELIRQLTAAVEIASSGFGSVEKSLNARITAPYGARPYLERSPYAAVVPLSAGSPLENTQLWQKLHQSEDGRLQSPALVRADLMGFLSALSDSAFASYKASILLAYAARVGDIRDLSKYDRNELTGVQQDAAQISRDIGAREDAQSKLDARIIIIGVPALAVALVALLLVPLLYRNIDLQRAIFSSGLMLELMMVFLLTGSIILLGLDGRIPAELIGTLLGGLSGYVLGRSINPLIVDRRG